MLRLSVAVFSILTLCACTHAGDDSSRTPCAEAAEVIAECTGETAEPPSTCEGESRAASETIVDEGCAALADSKADGGFWCSPATRWMGRCETNEPHRALLADYAPPNGRYEGVADAFAALAIDPDGPACSVEINSTDDQFEAMVHAHDMTDAIILSSNPLDYIVTFSEEEQDEFADGSGRTWRRVTMFVLNRMDEGDHTVGITIARFDNGYAEVSITPDDTPGSSCTFYVGHGNDASSRE